MSNYQKNIRLCSSSDPLITYFSLSELVIWSRVNSFFIGHPKVFSGNSTGSLYYSKSLGGHCGCIPVPLSEHDCTILVTLCGLEPLTAGKLRQDLIAHHSFVIWPSAQALSSCSPYCIVQEAIPHWPKALQYQGRKWPPFQEKVYSEHYGLLLCSGVWYPGNSN